MKKNKVIIPAMALILFSTAASVSGTVAWFTASRVFNTEVGNFQVVEIDGSLDVKMAPGQGTVWHPDALEPDHDVIDVRDLGIISVPTGSSAPAGDHKVDDLWIDTTSAPAMKKYNGTDWVAKTDMVADTYYYGVGTGKLYKATGASAIAVDDNKKNFKRW